MIQKYVQQWLRHTLIQREQQYSANRLEQQANLLRPYLDQRTLVLDVGCGSGELVVHLRELTGCGVLGLDLHATRTVDIELLLFDGSHIPLPDASVDYVLLSFVLHHSSDPFALCREVLRVARHGIFIFEDIPRSAAQHVMLALHLVSFAWIYQIGYSHAGIWDRSYIAALETLASACTVSVIDLPSVRFTWFYPITRQFYVFQMHSSSAATPAPT